MRLVMLAVSSGTFGQISSTSPYIYGAPRVISCGAAFQAAAGFPAGVDRLKACPTRRLCHLHAELFHCMILAITLILMPGRGLVDHALRSGIEQLRLPFPICIDAQLDRRDDLVS
jgi:hypothetical protein